MSSHYSRSILDDPIANQNSQFSHNRSRLTRQELYSYGFKEGQSWGDDRRALESALREIDEHEREIRENYLYNSPTRTNAPWSSYPTSPQDYSAAHSGTHYRSQLRSPPDFRINRSNGSDSQSSESSASPSWIGRQSSHPYRSFSESPGYSRGKSGRPDGFYSSTDYDTPGHPRRHSGTYGPPSVPRIRTTSLYPPPPPLNSASSSYRGYFPSEGDHPFAEPLSQYHENNVPTSPHSPTSYFPPNFIGRTDAQLVRHRDSGYAQREDSTYGEERGEEPPSPPHSSSPRWSVNGAQDVDSENLSDLSRVSYEAYNPSPYPNNVAVSSGYVESYHNYGTNYRESYLHDSDDSDHEYMSDGIASDEGVYYSSSEGPEEDYEGEEVFSDEGYGSSYSDDFYDSD